MTWRGHIPLVFGLFSGFFVVGTGCDRSVPNIPQAGSVYPHQDEWWPYHHISQSKLEQRAARFEEALATVKLESTARSEVAFLLACTLWLLDRNEEAFEIAHSINRMNLPVGRVELLERVIQRRLGPNGDALVSFSALRENELPEDTAALLNSDGWRRFSEWRQGERWGEAIDEQAAAAFLASGELDDTLGLLNLASLYIWGGKLGEAEHCLDGARQYIWRENGTQTTESMQSTRRTYWAMMGELRMRQLRWQEAESAIQEALEITGESQSIPIRDAYLLLMHGMAASQVEPSEAIVSLERAALGFETAAVHQKAPTQRDHLLEQARRALLHLAMARFRRGDQVRVIEEQLSVSLDRIAEYGASDGWFELLGRTIAGDRPLDRVLNSIPDSTDRGIESVVRLTVARRYFIEDKFDDALRCLAPLTELASRPFALEHAIALTLRTELQERHLQ